jgi:hypothetical protein
MLSQLLNLRIGIDGLELPIAVTNPIVDAITWPWPKLILTERFMFLATETAMYKLDGSWARTLVFNHSAGSAWDVVDFGSYVLLNNAVETYEIDVDTLLWAEVDYNVIPQVNTICNFNGQLFGGGVTSSWNSLDQRYAIWGNIGDLTFTSDEKLEAGHRDMMIGTILKCLPTSKGVVFYGEDGISMLSPAGSSTAFSYVSIAEFGISSKSLAAGMDDQICITDDYKLWLIKDGQITEVGYEYHLQNLNLSLVVITHDVKLNEFHISDGLYSYVFGKNGLYESSKCYTGLVLVDSTYYGCYSNVNVFGSIIDHSVFISSDVLDFNIVAIKNYEFIELGIETDGNIFSRVRLCYDNSKSVKYSPWVQVNNSGYAYHGCAANKAIIEFKIVNATELTFNYFTIGIKLTDNSIQNQQQTIADRSWNGGQINR